MKLSIFKELDMNRTTMHKIQFMLKCLLITCDMNKEWITHERSAYYTTFRPNAPPYHKENGRLLKQLFGMKSFGHARKTMIVVGMHIRVKYFTYHILLYLRHFIIYIMDDVCCYHCCSHLVEDLSLCHTTSFIWYCLSMPLYVITASKDFLKWYRKYKRNKRNKEICLSMCICDISKHSLASFAHISHYYSIAKRE